MAGMGQYRRVLCLGRAEDGYRLPLIAAIDSKVSSVDGDYSVLWVQLAHPHQAQIGQIRFTIGVALRQAGELN